MRMPYLSMESHYRQAQIYIDSNFRAFAWFMQLKFPDQIKVGCWMVKLKFIKKSGNFSCSTAFDPDLGGKIWITTDLGLSIKRILY